MMINIFGPCLRGGVRPRRMSENEDLKYQLWVILHLPLNKYDYQYTNINR